MRYKLDANGYVESVFWGCYSNGCAEYTGTVPYGYTNLNDWSENALINAYYLEDGNLVLDSDRLAELEAKIEQDSIENTPILYKDLYGTNDVLDSQYQKETATGQVIAIDNVKKINPKVKITDINCYKNSKVDVITQGKNMLKSNANTETISGITFTEQIDGGIKISGIGKSENLYNYEDTNVVSADATIDEDGWITITYDNTNGTSAKYCNYWTNNLNLKPSTNYLIVTEIKHVEGTGGLKPISTQLVNSVQVYGQFKEKNTNYYFDEVSDNTIQIAERTTVENPMEMLNGLRTYIFFSAGMSGSITFRISVLEDTTITADTFKYKPYGSPIEYNLSGSENNLTSLFALKKNKDYYLNVGGFDCEMNYYDGTTSQVYTGASGLINLSESKEVTQVLLKIPTETEIDTTIYPMLEYGSVASEYEEYKARSLTIDFNEFISEGLFPSDELYPSDELFPKGTTIDYIYIENGIVYISVNGVLRQLMLGNVNLFDGYNTVYTLQDTNIEMEYCKNLLEVDSLEFLQGKTTTTNKFKILTDGSIEAKDGLFSGTVKGSEFKGNTNDSISLKIGTDADGFMSEDNSLELEYKDGSRVLGVYGKFWESEAATTYFTSKLGRFAFIGSAGGGGTLFANSYENFSLEALKKNITSFDNGLALIKSSDIYKYNYRNETDKARKHIGLVIGEKYNTPNEVLNDEKTSVDLYSMIGVAWQSIKELNVKIEELENKIKELESEK